MRGESADSLRRKLRGDLDTICLKALHPEPQRRYRSAEALADDLQRVLDGLPVRARPDTLVYRAGKFLRRNRWSASFAAALFVVAIGFGAFASIAASRIAEQSKAVSLERDRARATADFLTDLFTLADPTRAERDYTATEMLDRGLEKLSENERLSDRERNAVLAAVGGVFQVRGDHERARQVLAEAVELARRGGVAPRDYASSLLELTKAEYRLADYAAAILEQVVKARQTLPDVDGRRNLAANLNNLGLIYSELGWLDRAEAAFDAALEIVERDFSPEHPYNAFLRHSRAVLLEQRGEFEQARTELRVALDTATTALGEEHPFVAQVRDDLAAIRAYLIPATIRNAGSIAAGTGSADAITFSSEDDALELEPGSSVTGNVLASTGWDLLMFTGMGSDSFSLDDVGVGNKYQDFELLELESGSWTFSGTMTEDFS